MSIFDTFTQIFGNPAGTMAFTTPNSLVGEAGALGGGAYLGGQGLMGLDSGAADPFGISNPSEFSFGELGLPSTSNIPILGDISNIIGGINALRGGGGGDPLSTMLNNDIKDPSLAQRVLPGAMALGYAASQPNLDLGSLNGIMGSLQGNQNAVVQAATDPIQRNIAAGYGDLLQSQALRGIRGSSFGDTDIANYISDTGRALGNAGANAMQGSLGLQSDLATNIAQLQNQRQQLKNQLYGQAFDVLGRGLNPQGYAANLGGYNIPGMAGTSAQPSKLQTLAGIGGSVNNILGNFGSSLGGMVSGIGHALGF